jgi:hypothetical protein
MKYLFLFLIYSQAAFSLSPPRLIQMVGVSEPDCSTMLSHEKKVDDLSSKQAAQEYEQMLRLTHPLVNDYFSLMQQPTRVASFIHRDLRLLALIYGDQKDLELKKVNGLSPFDRFNKKMGWWRWRSPLTRLQLTERLVDTIANSQWKMLSITEHTLFLDSFATRSGFRTGRFHEWTIAFPNHWEVLDRQGISQHLHERLYSLRERLKSDEQMRAELVELLFRDLPATTAAMRKYLTAYYEYGESMPDMIERTIAHLRQARKRLRK